MFPGAEVELVVGDGDDDLAAHDLSFEVCVGVVFSGAVVEVAALVGVGVGVEGCELLEPAVVVLDEALLIVIDVDGCGDVHGVDEA